MRLVLVIHALTPGGAERVLSVLANHWVRSGHEVCVLTLAGPHTPYYALDPTVRVQHLGLSASSGSLFAALDNNLARARGLRSALKAAAPDLAIAFMTETNVLTLLATRGLGISVIATEHTVPGVYYIGAKWELLRRLAYPLAECVVVPTRRGAEDFRRFARARFVSIPNPVDFSPAEPASPLPLPLPPPLLLSMGRLAPEKGYDLLLKAFARLAPAFPHWTLVILGEGPLRKELTAQAEALGLSGRLLLPGNVADPSHLLRAADLFALTSHFEGFSNALAEALACGLPAVAVDCPFGPGEIITHGRNGLLVPPGDEDALVEALGRLMGDASLRGSMAANAPEVLARFGVEVVGAAWDGLLNVASARGRRKWALR